MYPQGAEGFASFSDAGQKFILESLLSTQRFSKAQEAARERKATLEKSQGSLKSSLMELSKFISDKQVFLEELKQKDGSFAAEKAAKIHHFKTILERTKANKPPFDPSLNERYQAFVAKFSSPAIKQARTVEVSTNNRILALERSVAQLQGEIRITAERLASYPKEEPPKPEQSMQALASEYDRLSKQVMVLETQIAHAQIQLVDIDRELSGIDALRNCPSCEQPISGEAKRKLAGMSGQKRARLIGEISSHGANLTKLKADLGIAEGYYYCALSYAKWEEAEHLRNDLLRKNQELATSTERLEMFRKSLQDITTVIAEANAATHAALDLERRIKEQNAALDLWEKDCAALEDKVLECENEESPYASLIASAYDDLATKITTYNRKAELLRDIETRSLSASFWAEGFGNKGVKSLLLDTVTPILNATANEYLEYLTEGTAKVEFSTQTKLKSGELREKFNVAVDFRFGAGAYTGTSGGERKRVDMAVLFALGDLAASRARAPIELRLLDEPSESLDSPGIEKLVRLLKEKITPQAKTLLVMTHLDDLKSLFDQRILVVKENGISRIEEN
jgi:DNA repair exonuclease SbcCD ATPase subunit